MKVQATLLSLTTLALASDLSAPMHMAQKRAIENLQPRQTDVAEATACLSSLFAFYSTIPTPPPGLENLEVDEDAITDICTYTPPASIAPAYSSWVDQVSSWAKDTIPKISSVLAGCPEWADTVDSVTSVYQDLCTNGGVLGGGSSATPTSGSGPAETGAGAGSQQTGTGTGASSQQTKPAGSGATREKGFVAGALAVVGLVALL